MTPTRRDLLRAGAGALAVGLVGSAETASAATTVPPWHPTRLTHLGDASQVVVVAASSWRTTWATLRGYERSGAGTWREVVPATSARLGSRGLVRGGQRRQNTGTTPAGTYGLVAAFGLLADPGARLSYRRLAPHDTWPYEPRDPRTYNVFQTRDVPGRWRSQYVEHLAQHRVQYRYVVVLDFNLPAPPYVLGADGLRRAARPPDTRRGGGIFLHVSDGRSTAGCIAVSQSAMRRILRWLDPARRPVIVVGPTSALPTL